MSLRWDGLDELRAELRNLPKDLADEAGPIVVAAAEGAKEEIVAGYERHAHTGNLAAHVKVEPVSIGPYGAALKVRSSAKHAFLFEIGTQGKERQTKTGASRGSMPPARIFIPTAIRRRRTMYERLKDLLVTHGATVTGEP